jgi:outer membrane lipoprotein-sorting protein
LKYPKKIYCKYQKNNKILVSNGKSLVVRTITSYYKYPLSKTPLNLILDKNFLIKKIYNLKEEKLDKNYINFVIKENDHEINIFFDEKTFNLIGWQTVDIYQNINVTYLSSILINQQIETDLFKLPAQN